MVNVRLFVILILLSFASLMAQNSETTAAETTPNPCEHPLIRKALVDGLNSLTLKEVPEYWYQAWLCKRYAKKAGIAVDFSAARGRKREELRQPVEEISGPGAFCATCVTVVVVFSYYSYLAGPEE